MPHRFATALLIFSAQLLLSACHGISADEFNAIKSTLAIEPGEHIADIGAGDGEVAAQLSAWVGDTGRVYATELGEQAVEILQSRFAETANVTVVEAAVRASNLPANCCDALLMRNVYHHLSQPDDTLDSLYRALKPGGRFLIIDFPPSRLLSLWTPEDLPTDRDGHGISPELIEAEAAAHGFDVVQVIPEWSQGWHDGFAVLAQRP